MVAHLDTTTPLHDEKLRLAVNAHLPPDVRVLEVRTRAHDFQSQFDCRYRRYLYRMRTVREDPRGLALNRDRVLPVFDAVDVDAMRRACEALVGRHDFGAFATQETRTREREVYLCELRSERGELRLHIAADGFLRNMVRGIVGTLLWVGTGRLSSLDVADIVSSGDRGRAGPNVAPHGLYFVEAGYEPWDRTVSDRRVADLVV
jgi:tRNA pseudouridine38-40 synthase